MKNLILCLPFLNIHINYAQTFQLNDTTFEVGDVYTSTPRIYFDLCKPIIQSRSYNHLDSIARFLIKYDSLHIEIGWHTDSRGSDNLSTRLDRKRAESIVEYLHQKGVSKERMIPKGFGKTQPLIPKGKIDQMKTDKEKEEAHAINRRTTFKIIKIEPVNG